MTEALTVTVIILAGIAVAASWAAIHINGEVKDMRNDKIDYREKYYNEQREHMQARMKSDQYRSELEAKREDAAVSGITIMTVGGYLRHHPDAKRYQIWGPSGDYHLYDTDGHEIAMFKEHRVESITINRKDDES